jgi:hypothetical protein
MFDLLRVSFTAPSAERWGISLLTLDFQQTPAPVTEEDSKQMSREPQKSLRRISGEMEICPRTWRLLALGASMSNKIA